MLYRISYIEQMGTGIVRMKNATRAAHVAEPVFELTGFFKVTFKRNTAQSTAVGDKQAITSDWQAIKTGDRKRTIVAFIEEHELITAAEAAEILNLSKGRVRAILQEMTSEGTIKKVGNNRYTYYVLKSEKL